MGSEIIVVLCRLPSKVQAILIVNLTKLQYKAAKQYILSPGFII